MLADLLSRPQRRHTPCRGKEAHQPPPESECIPFAVAGVKVFRHTFSHRFFMWGIYFKQIVLVPSYCSSSPIQYYTSFSISFVLIISISFKACDASWSASRFFFLETNSYSGVIPSCFSSFSMRSIHFDNSAS